jgi:hypothetical protein
MLEYGEGYLRANDEILAELRDFLGEAAFEVAATLLAQPSDPSEPTRA